MVACPFRGEIQKSFMLLDVFYAEPRNKFHCHMKRVACEPIDNVIDFSLRSHASKAKLTRLVEKTMSSVPVDG
ncbi:MAG TPA: hypothetical protein DDZ51_06860 [Planctomycetaceae bacterium]|nr:hypothetical protein [Planctomycetaceae bacterium]